jgi:Ribose/xylose/arabinose/galactoside ABC-type transport systems, permease components
MPQMDNLSTENKEQREITTARNSFLSTVLKSMKRNIVGLTMLGIFLIFIITCPNFFSLENILSIIREGGILSLLALAMTVVLIVGGMEMSAGAIADFTTNLTAGLLMGGSGLAIALILPTFTGLLLGVFNGCMVVFFGIPPFIATVGTMFCVTGLTFAYNHGQSILLRNQPAFFNIAQGSIWTIPNLAIIALVVTAVLYVFFRRYRLGSYLYAVGNNSLAAKVAGIKTGWPQILAFAISGLLSGIAGVLSSSYISGAVALGSSFELLITAFAAAFLGSMLIRQGELNPVGTVIAAMFITAVSNALTLYGTSHLLFPAIQGLILILALIISNLGKREIGQMTIF